MIFAFSFVLLAGGLLAVIKTTLIWPPVVLLIAGGIFLMIALDDVLG